MDGDAEILTCEFCGIAMAGLDGLLRRISVFTGSRFFPSGGVGDA